MVATVDVDHVLPPIPSSIPAGVGDGDIERGAPLSQKHRLHAVALVVLFPRPMTRSDGYRTLDRSGRSKSVSVTHVHTSYMIC